MTARRYNPNHPDRRPRRWGAVLSCVAPLAVLAGCGGDAPVQFTINEQEMGRIAEELVEIPLGQYEVPVPAPYADDSAQTRYKTALLFRFRLDALVEPHESGSTARLIGRNKNSLRDRVMTTCRNSSVNELLDPQLTAFRARVLDEIQPLFEGHLVRRLVITEVLTDPM